MPRIAYLVSSAREIDLRDSSNHPTGYWAEEALKSYERLVAAGAEVVVITPDGKAPVADPYSLEPQFHYPDSDRDYFGYRSTSHFINEFRDRYGMTPRACSDALAGRESQDAGVVDQRLAR